MSAVRHRGLKTTSSCRFPLRSTKLTSIGRINEQRCGHRPSNILSVDIPKRLNPLSLRAIACLRKGTDKSSRLQTSTTASCGMETKNLKSGSKRSATTCSCRYLPICRQCCLRAAARKTLKQRSLSPKSRRFLILARLQRLRIEIHWAREQTTGSKHHLAPPGP